MKTHFTKKKISKQADEIKDTGFGTQTPRQRSVNIDGTFNIERTGLSVFRLDDVYTNLITMKWRKFIPLVLVVYAFINVLFAMIYYSVGVNHLGGVKSITPIDQFFDAFFFSAQTISTVGYGHISPEGFLSSLVAALESLLGVLVFAVITGLLYGRFSAPKAKILYSTNAIIAPFKDGRALMFRIANKRKNQLIEVEMEVTVGMNMIENDTVIRRFYSLKLENRKINFFPLSWTIVHPITEDSPLYNFTQKDFEEADAEILTLFKGFDDTYSQIVHSRKSFMYDEILWGKRFVSIIGQNDEGKTSLALDKMNEMQNAELPMHISLKESQAL